MGDDGDETPSSKKTEAHMSKCQERLSMGKLRI